MSSDARLKPLLLQELQAISHDYKAGVVAAELIDNGVDADIISFKNLSIFKRFISREIEEVKWEQRDNDTDQLVFFINREGLYDMLPEAITHGQFENKKGEGNHDQFLKQKLEEKNSRKFFSPIENEFAARALYFDIIERELFQNSNAQRNRAFFEFFFERSSSLSDEQVITLMYILPLSHRIRADIKLIGITLSRILNCKAEVKKKALSASRYGNKEAIRQTLLGEGTLGVNTVVSDNWLHYHYRYELHIYNIPKNNYRHFMPLGKHHNVIKFIEPYFFPANAVVCVILHPQDSEKDFFVFEQNSSNFLGFNSYI